MGNVIQLWYVLCRLIGHMWWRSGLSAGLCPTTNSQIHNTDQFCIYTILLKATDIAAEVSKRTFATEALVREEVARISEIYIYPKKNFGGTFVWLYNTFPPLAIINRNIQSSGVHTQLLCNVQCAMCSPFWRIWVHFIFSFYLFNPMCLKEYLTLQKEWRKCFPPCVTIFGWFYTKPKFYVQ